MVIQMKFSVDKAYEYQSLYGKQMLYFSMGIYNHDKSLALMASTFNDLYQLDEPYGYITVCLGREHKRARAFVDVNNLPGIDKVLEHYGIAKPTGVKVTSGFVVYPEYIFSENFLRTISPDAYEEYLKVNHWTVG